MSIIDLLCLTLYKSNSDSFFAQNKYFIQMAINILVKLILPFWSYGIPTNSENPYWHTRYGQFCPLLIHRENPPIRQNVSAIGGLAAWRLWSCFQGHERLSNFLKVKKADLAAFLFSKYKRAAFCFQGLNRFRKGYYGRKEASKVLCKFEKQVRKIF
jgi:hypothetical protein